jgi:AcrR family transcriptional regulator
VFLRHEARGARLVTLHEYEYLFVFGTNVPRLAIAPRKAPTQERSTQLVADILAAAIRVLEKEGPFRFTTIRVARAAGVSVGSLYQYFPNKQSILYRLQVDEWARTEGLIESILTDASKPPAVRARIMMRAFFQSELDEAPLRLALDAAAPSWHDRPAVERANHHAIVEAFVAEAAPRSTRGQRRFATELVLMTVGALGERVSERHLSRKEIDRWADEVSTMLMGYLAALAPEVRARPRSRSASRARPIRAR